MPIKIPLKYHFFLIPATVITLTYGFIFIAGHQIYRSLANDPQIQISEDMAHYLQSGKEASEVMPNSEVDISTGKVWFLTIYNDQGEVIASNARLNGQAPELPAGVLEHAKNDGQNIVTWEPTKGVRIATVVTSYNGGYVLAGRSLQETDMRIKELLMIVVLGWALSIGVAFGGFWYLVPNLKKLH